MSDSRSPLTLMVRSAVTPVASPRWPRSVAPHPAAWQLIAAPARPRNRHRRRRGTARLLRRARSQRSDPRRWEAADCHSGQIVTAFALRNEKPRSRCCVGRRPGLWASCGGRPDDTMAGDSVTERLTANLTHCSKAPRAHRNDRYCRALAGCTPGAAPQAPISPVLVSVVCSGAEQVTRPVVSYPVAKISRPAQIEFF